MILVDVVIIIILSFIYGFIHSFLASEKIKKKIVKKIGDRIAFYRFAYNVFALLLFLLLIEIAPDPNVKVLDLYYPYDMYIYGLQLLSLYGIIYTFKYSCLKEFLGISQIQRWLNGNYNQNDLDSNDNLYTGGLYKYSRHPLYLFTILFLLFRPYWDLQYLTFFVMAVIYFYIGAYYEEKKLINKFGNQYLKYKSKVPKIIPYKIFRG